VETRSKRTHPNDSGGGVKGEGSKNQQNMIKINNLNINVESFNNKKRSAAVENKQFNNSVSIKKCIEDLTPSESSNEEPESVIDSKD
jgi:hypothetical protein